MTTKAQTIERNKSISSVHDRKYNEVQIDCPEHSGEHTATLYKHGHSSEPAGIWECLDGNSECCDAPVSDFGFCTDCKEHSTKQTASDVHECEEFYDDTATSDHMGFQGHYQTETPIKVCEVCEVAADE